MIRNDTFTTATHPSRCLWVGSSCHNDLSYPSISPQPKHRTFSSLASLELAATPRRVIGQRLEYRKLWTRACELINFQDSKTCAHDSSVHHRIHACAPVQAFDLAASANPDGRSWASACRQQQHRLHSAERVRGSPLHREEVCYSCYAPGAVTRLQQTRYITWPFLPAGSRADLVPVVPVFRCFCPAGQ
jgi:hypothetical protein